jgi:hypothetical protein
MARQLAVNATSTCFGAGLAPYASKPTERLSGAEK